MKYSLIQETIEDLEQGETTFFNCQNLAALYIVREYLHTDYKEPNSVEKELADILPQYIRYKIIKRNYQLNETTREQVIKSIGEVCTEIKDFISMLFNSSDMEEERKELTNLIISLYNRYGKTTR